MSGRSSGIATTETANVASGRKETKGLAGFSETAFSDGSYVLLAVNCSRIARGRDAGDGGPVTQCDAARDLTSARRRAMSRKFGSRLMTRSK
jgi:hypothetical protein